MTWEKLSGWLKEQGGTITTIIVIFGALFAGARYIIRSEVADIRSDVSMLKGDTKTLDDRLEATNHKIDGLLKDALDRAFPRTVGKSDVHATLTQADNIIRFAKERNIELNPPTAPGTYYITVNAASGTAQTSYLLTLTVN
jgi:hypothetical protein